MIQNIKHEIKVVDAAEVEHIIEIIWNNLIDRGNISAVLQAALN